MTTAALNRNKDYALYYLHNQDLSVFVLKTSPPKKRKHPDVPSTDSYFERKCTDEEINKWFTTNPDYNIAIPMGTVTQAIAFDVDGPNAGERIKSKIPEMSSILREAFQNTMKNKTGSGSEHVVFKVEGDISDLKKKQLWSDGKPHSQILMLANRSYIVAAPSLHPNGLRYEWNGKSPVTITRQELDEFIRLVSSENQREQYVPSSRNITESATAVEGPLRSLTPGEMQELQAWLKPYYTPGNRDHIVFYLSGMMRKANFSHESARRFITLLYNGSEYSDEDLDKSLTVVDNTYRKPLNELNGKSGMHNLLVTSFETSSEYDEIEYLRRIDTFSHICQIFNGEPTPPPPSPPPPPHQETHQQEQSSTSGYSGQQQLQQQKGETDAETKVRGLTETLERQYHFAAMEDTDELFYYKESKGLYEPAESLVKTQVEKQYPGILTNTVTNVIEKLARRHLVKRKAFDADLLIWNMANGLYDVRTNTLRDHTWEYLSRKQIPIRFNPTIKPKKFGKFLSEVVYPQQVRTVIEAMAYTFLRDNPFEIYNILVGFGSNGKSVLMHVLTKLHGEDSVSNTSLNMLLKDKFAKKDLEDKNVNIDMEMSGGTIDDLSILKELTGQQPIRIEPKYMQAYTTRLWAKHWGSANEMPRIKDDSDAHFRRENIISFPNQFVDGVNANPNLKYELTTEEELSGIFNVLMMPLRRIATKHKPPYMDTKTIQERKLKHQLVTDPVKAFLEIAVEPKDYESDPDVTKEELYEGYRKFCAFYKIPWQKYEPFCKAVKASGVKDGRETYGERRRIWLGIRLKKSLFEDTLTV